MQNTHKIDLTKLLGFAAVSADVQGRVNFQDACIDARLGAKVGAEDLVALDLVARPAGAAAKVD